MPVVVDIPVRMYLAVVNVENAQDNVAFVLLLLLLKINRQGT